MGLSGTVSQFPLANLIISVTAETKNAMKQVQSLNVQTKKTDKKAVSAMGRALKGIMAVAAPVAIIVAGLAIAVGVAWGLFKSSTYYAQYSKMWSNEATMISNEWVRRHKGVFDKFTNAVEKVRREYVSNKDQSLPGAIAKVYMDAVVSNASNMKTSIITKSMTIPGDIAKVIMGSLSEKATGMKTSIITKGMAFLTTISQGYENTMSYLKMWVTYYIMPIYNFIKDIMDFVSNIIIAIQNFINAVWDALSIIPGIERP